MSLSHVNCFINREVIAFQILLDSLHPRIFMFVIFVFVCRVLVIPQ